MAHVTWSDGRKEERMESWDSRHLQPNARAYLHLASRDWLCVAQWFKLGLEELRDIENGVLLFLLTCLSPPPGHLTQNFGVKGHKMSRNFVMSQVRGACSFPTTIDAALSTHHLFTLLQAHPHKRSCYPHQPTPTHPRMSPLWGSGSGCT